jgi:hypothetical protein
MPDQRTGRATVPDFFAGKAPLGLKIQDVEGLAGQKIY